MKIYDCFMYFDEEEVLDLRLNILKDKIDYFVIVESTYNHKGEKRQLLFDKSKFKKFNSKIIYLVFDKVPDEVQKVSNDDSLEEKDRKYIMNAVYRENSQRNYIYEGLKKCEKNDLILISDVDEIPKLNFLDLKKVDTEKFPSIKIIKQLKNNESSLETLIVLANDILVDLFLLKKIYFTDIVRLLQKIINMKKFKNYKLKKINNINSIILLNNQIRTTINNVVK